MGNVELKVGRPRRDEVREKLVHVGFRADQATLKAIAKLSEIAASERGLGSAKSVAIRRALIAAADKLSQGSHKALGDFDDSLEPNT